MVVHGTLKAEAVRAMPWLLSLFYKDVEVEHRGVGLKKGSTKHDRHQCFVFRLCITLERMPGLTGAVGEIFGMQRA